MGDLGFGSLIAKAEEYFGRGLTRAIFALVLIFIVVAAVSGIWSLAVAPLLAYFAKVPSAWAVVINTIGLGLTIGGTMSIGSMLLDAYRKRLATDEIERTVPAARELFEEVKAASAELKADKAQVARLMYETREVTERGEALVALSWIAVEEVVESGLKSGRLTDEQATVIRALAAEARSPPGGNSLQGEHDAAHDRDDPAHLTLTERRD